MRLSLFFSTIIFSDYALGSSFNNLWVSSSEVRCTHLLVFRLVAGLDFANCLHTHFGVKPPRSSLVFSIGPFILADLLYLFSYF